MNRHIILIIATCLALAVAGCRSDSGREELSHHHHDHDGEHHDHDGEHHDHDDDAITLEPEVAERMGVEVENIQPGEFAQVIKVSGELSSSAGDNAVATATSSGVVRLSRGIQPGARVSAGQTIATISSQSLAGGDVNAAAKAALESAKRELDRLTPLHKEGIVSTRDYNEALQTYQQAKAAYSGSPSGGTVKALKSGVITSLDVTDGQGVETGQAVATIGGANSLTLKADVPVRYSHLLPGVNSANFKVLSTNQVFSTGELGGKLMSNSNAAASGGYIPVYFSLASAPGLIPGTAVEVYLNGSTRRGVLSVPRAAIVEQQGNHYIYIRLDEDCYEKCPVTIGASDGRRVEIVSGLQAGKDVVVKGATAVKLAETSGVVPEGHSHNH